MEERCFLVFYEVFSAPTNGQVISNKLGPGHTVMVTDGKFLNQDAAIENIKNGEHGTNSFFKQKTIPLIRNIIELSKNDYEEWIR